MKKKAARHILLIALAMLLIASSTAVAAPFGSRSLHTGNTGDDVTELQQRLTALGYNPGPANGLFSASTQQALAAFQQTYGLTPDGMAGKATYKALDQAYQWASNHPNPVPPSMLAVPPVSPLVVKSVPPATPRTVLGYYAEDYDGDTRSLSSLQNSLQQVNLAVNFELAIGADGSITARSYPALMTTAQQQGVKVQGLVHNLTANGFDPAVATAILSDPTVRSTAVKNLVAAAQQYGLAGINVDLENVPPTLRPDYTAFITELYGAMKQVGLGLTLSVPAKTEDIPESPWTGAFDYAALAPYADKIVIMTYDEHLPGFPAGPIASIPWVDQVMAYVVTQIPHDKVLLGVAAYAYNWVQGTTTGIAQSVPNALNLVAQYHATIQWDPTAMVPFFTYTNSSGQNRIVYFENAQSTAAKLAIMRKYDLGGIAIWRLGLEEPGIWPVVAQQINR